MYSIGEFISKNLGVPNIGTNVANSGQCVGLVMLWIAKNNRPFFYGDADNLLKDAPRASYNVVLNTPNNYPVSGDIVCWDSSWGGGFGHTAVVVWANPEVLLVFQQNNPMGASPNVAVENYDGVEGWLRFK